MKQEISKECKEFLKKLLEDKDISDFIYVKNECLYIDSSSNNDLLYSNGRIGYDDINNVYNLPYYKYIDRYSLLSIFKNLYLPFTEVEMKFIFDKLRKFCENKKQEDARKSLLMKLNLTESELQQLKTILK